MNNDRFEASLLPGLPVERIRSCFTRSRGNEIDSGKFASAESSAALAANAFGFFLERPGTLPLLPGCAADDWPATDVDLEAQMRFPWRGGLHPWLDAAVVTDTTLIGIESKRYEPFRTTKPSKDAGSRFSVSYSRPVWGDEMVRYQAMRDAIARSEALFVHLDAVQLVKHAFGIRTQAHRLGLKPMLLYLYAEPVAWPNDTPVQAEGIAQHRDEINRFAAAVAGDEVAFGACTYRALLDGWMSASDPDLRSHADAVRSRFRI